MLKFFKKKKNKNTYVQNVQDVQNVQNVTKVHEARPLSIDLGYERSPGRRPSEIEKSRIENKTNMRMMSAFIREIHAPVSDLCGLQNILPDIPQGSSIYHYAKSMNTCGLLLADMIENMKCYYLIASDLYDVKLTSFSLRAEIMTSWNNIIEEHDKYSSFQDDFVVNMGVVECSIHFEKSVPSGIVVSDSFCLLKVFSSIVSNAVRFTLEGFIKVELYVSQTISEESNEGYETLLNMVVTDTGVGIEEDLQEVIFDPLTKAHSESIQGGVGMGLPVSRGMCRMLGGDLLLVSSSEKKGSVFHATIPITFDISHDVLNSSYSETSTIDPEDQKCRGASSVSITDNDGDDSMEMPRVLLVEDVKLNRMIVSKMMGDVSVFIETAENGLEALKNVSLRFSM